MEQETGMLFLQLKLAQETLREAGEGVPLARPYALGARGFGGEWRWFGCMVCISVRKSVP